ncbi:hypothetical protein D3C73_1472420 [compost metagenome]
MQAICAAADKSEREIHVVYTVTVKVCTPRNSDAPMSLSVSSSARLIPTASAGRAIGRATRKKVPLALQPRVRAASNKCAGWLINVARVVK